MADFRSGDLFWTNYLAPCIMLLLCVCVAMIFGLCNRWYPGTMSEYMSGSKTLQTFPIAMSLLSTFVSAVTVVSLPVHIYNSDFQYWMNTLTMFFVVAIALHLYLPVFTSLQCSSVNEYLEMRFNFGTRIVGAVLFLLQMILFIPIVMLVAAETVSQITGFDLYATAAILFAVSILYTTIGGFRGIVWTDMLQIFVLLVSLIVTVVFGTLRARDFTTVWRRNYNGGKLNLNFSTNPTVGDTVWTYTFGNFFVWLYIVAVCQLQVQRYLALPTKQMAKSAMWIYAIGFLLVNTLSIFIGFLLYNAAVDCNQLVSENSQSSAKVFSAYVVELLRIPGLIGLIAAGVIASSLSSMSAALHGTACVVMEDVIKRSLRRNWMPPFATWVMKCVILGCGIFCYGLTLLASLSPYVIPIFQTVFVATASSSIGIYSLGMLFPWTNSAGALVGGIIPFVFNIWIGIGRQLTVVNKLNEGYSTGPAAKCSNSSLWNFENNNATVTRHKSLFVYRVSDNWHSAITCIMTLVIGLIVSLSTGPMQTQELHPTLISPPMLQLSKKISNRWHVFRERRSKTSTNEELPDKFPKKQEYGDEVELQPLHTKETDI